MVSRRQQRYSMSSQTFKVCGEWASTLSQEYWEVYRPNLLHSRLNNQHSIFGHMIVKKQEPVSPLFHDRMSNGNCSHGECLFFCSLTSVALDTFRNASVIVEASPHYRFCVLLQPLTILVYCASPLYVTERTSDSPRCLCIKAHWHKLYHIIPRCWWGGLRCQMSAGL